jgi:hypothetical protein
MDDRGARSDHRLRPEKSQSVARTRGFESRHLQERCVMSCSALLGVFVQLAVAVEDLPGPCDHVGGTRSWRLWPRPELQVFETVVVADAFLW